MWNFLKDCQERKVSSVDRANVCEGSQCWMLQRFGKAFFSRERVFRVFQQPFLLLFLAEQQIFMHHWKMFSSSHRGTKSCRKITFRYCLSERSLRSMWNISTLSSSSSLPASLPMMSDRVYREQNFYICLLVVYKNKCKTKHFDKFVVIARERASVMQFSIWGWCEKKVNRITSLF